MLLLAQVHYKLWLALQIWVFMMSLNTALEKEFKTEEGPKQQYNSKINRT